MNDQLPSPTQSIFDAIGCPHGTYTDDGPDAFGDRICARCERKVRVTLTALAFKTFANHILPGTFKDVD